MVYSYSFEHMSVPLVPDHVRDDICKSGYREDNAQYLNLGCGKEYWDKPWVNLDACPDIKADVYCDLDDKNLVLPFEDNTFDLIWASHIFEHIWYFRQLKDEMCRILKKGALLSWVVPCFLFADAWGDDTHCRAFSASSWLSCYWPGYSGGVWGQLPIKTVREHNGPTIEGEYWLWGSKQKL